jgi:3-deoxy-D-manno-octulosonic acid kinase
MIEARIQTTADGAILFDPGIAAQAGAGEFDPQWFDPAYWRAQGLAEAVRGGRGANSYIDAPFGASVLRHYVRGGMVAGIMGDRYLWTGTERTRGFAEFRLLAALRSRGLRAPVPVAARYQRRGPYYRADLITRRIDAARTLGEMLGETDATTAARVGAAIAEFHAAGACHADLNAHNVLIAGDRVWLVDFDRGRLRAPDVAWQSANLARLRRSLVKLGAARKREAAFADSFWKPLTAAYARRLGELGQAPLRSAPT